VSKPSLLSVPELAEYLGIKPKTIYAKVEADEIPHLRIGKLIRFRLEEIDVWLEDCRARRAVTLEKPKPRKKKSSTKKSSDHVSAIITKVIDDESNKYYDSGYGKLDRIEGLGKES